MASNAKECDERNRLIKEQREVVATQFHELKAEMNKMRDLERYSVGLKKHILCLSFKGFNSLCQSTSSAQKAHY